MALASPLPGLARRNQENLADEERPLSPQRNHPMNHIPDEVAKNGLNPKTAQGTPLERREPGGLPVGGLGDLTGGGDVVPGLSSLPVPLRRRERGDISLLPELTKGSGPLKSLQ